MKKASAKTLSEATPELDISRLFDREIKDGDTADLIRRLIGEDAEARYRGHRSLWQLLEERTPELHWIEQERIDIIAEIVARLGGEARRPAAVPIDGPESAAVLFAHLALLDHEELWVAYLNNQNIPLAVIQMGIGSVSSVVGFPCRIFREALLRNANGICSLCRARHNTTYADRRIMPRTLPPRDGGDLGLRGIIRGSPGTRAARPSA